MTRILQKLFPITPSIQDDDEYNPEYSFAMEYKGSPVTFNIPRAVPLEVDDFPTASVAAPSALFNNMALPIIQPIAKSKPYCKKLPKEFKLESEGNLSSNSETLSGKLIFPGEVMLSDVHGISCYSVNIIQSSSELDSFECDEIASCSTLGYFDSRDDSRELSITSEVDCLRVSEICPCSEDDNCSDEILVNVNRSPVVKFRDLESSEIIPNGSSRVKPEVTQERKVIRANVKKGLCNRCKKANRFKEKEVCIVCGAQYCGDCVLREMGSMPEGRKCVTCIGYPIDETRRGTLGKSSRVLKRLLDEEQVKQIMLSEASCDANQLPPELVYVNEKPLCREELALLQGCQHPPKKLRPGKYWYDQVSGLWGKEGERPCQIISPQLGVGGTIQKNASNGNTNVMINYREITKTEVWMLQMAGVHCEGSPHFWVSADGSYQEEGMNNVNKGLWNKVGTKLVCAVLKLPTPPQSANSCGEEIDNLANSVVPNLPEQNELNKLLLVGHNKSGTSTIFKQAKIVYNVPFSKDELEDIKGMIQRNLYGYIAIVLEGRGRFEEEWISEMRKKYMDQPGPSAGITIQTEEENIYSIRPKLKAFSDWLLQIMLSGNLGAIFPAACREYAPFVQEIWEDRSFQASYSRRDEFDTLPKVANYFLNRAVEISRPNYEPSLMDIQYAEGLSSSNGIASMEFSFPKSPQDEFTDPAEQNTTTPMQRFQLIRLNASSLGKNLKWLEMFEDVNLVLFCVSLTDYDQYCDDGNGSSTNKMLEIKKLFETIVTNPTFYNKHFLLLLNKFDILAEKIQHVPLTHCEWFQDFNPVFSVNHSSSNYSSLAQRAFHYIAVKFKRLFTSLTGEKLYVSAVSGLEPESVDEAMRYAREIMKWDEQNVSSNGGDPWSSCSIEESSTS